MNRQTPQGRQSEVVMHHDAATRPQIEAADPGTSAWVMANAGTGKTRVLTNRVARLLVEGVQPERILCITYTNAAANNMNSRLTEIFSDWSMLPDDCLRDKLLELGIDETSINQGRLRYCRTLLTMLVESSGGINITTVHAFASALLRKFPMEAGVSPWFTIIEERNQHELVMTVLDQLARDRPEIFEDICDFTNHYSFEGLAINIMANRRAFNSELCIELGNLIRNTGLKRPLGPPDDCSWQLRELIKDYNGWDELSHRVAFTEDHLDMLNAFLMQLDHEGDEKSAEKIRQILESSGEDALAKAYPVFLYSATAKAAHEPKTDRFVRKSIMENLSPHLVDELNNYAELLASLLKRQFPGLIARRTFSCHRLAMELFIRLDEYQKRHACLFYDDLLMRSHEMLSNPRVSDWVLYRLDSSIDHILVDEAQDMNDRNWDIVSRLSEEFVAGSGQHDGNPRTMFAVGDQKQSIFGFQGANPYRFNSMLGHYRSEFRNSGQRFIERDLMYSFRSSQAILDVVQKTFSQVNARGFAEEIPHKAYNTELPGRVDMLEFMPSTKTPSEPVSMFDTLAGDSDDLYTGENEYALMILDVVRQVLDSTIPDKQGPRKARPGDIMILVQTRGEVYNSLVRALNRSNLPFSGSDRLKMSEPIAIKDIMALLSFLALGSDDHSLACVLRSPLCDLTDDELFDLAQGRNGTLYGELVARAEENGKYGKSVAMIRDLQEMEDGNNPYQVIERLLTIHEGMKKLSSRLGTEVVEAIDILLAQSIEYESSNVPSLTGFIEWLELDRIDVARKIRQDSDVIRVMTVHGAKGLESPIIIMPESGHRSNMMRKGLYSGQDDLLYWLEKDYILKDEHAYIWNRKINELDVEKLCLLYVAMTRAECWLIVCGTGKQDTKTYQPPGRRWYSAMREAMDEMETVRVDYPKGVVDEEENWHAIRYQYGNWPEKPARQVHIDKRVPAPLPEWLVNRVDIPAEDTRKTISPSKLGEDDHEFSVTTLEGGEQARTRGTLIHLLLEHLPLLEQHDRIEVAEQLVRQNEPDISPGLFEEIYNKCEWLLGKQDLKHLFEPHTMSEVPVTACLPDGFELPLYGIIDKLVVRDGKVLAVDYKSHSSPPDLPGDIPEEILRQMGAYQWALDRIYPDHEVELAVLWTENGKLMPVPREMAVSALLDCVQ